MVKTLKVSSVGIYAPLNTARLAGDTVRILELVKGLRSNDISVDPILPYGMTPEIGKKFTPYTPFRVPMPSNTFARFASLSLYCQYFPPDSVYNSQHDILQIEGAFVFPLSKIRRIAKRK